MDRAELIREIQRSFEAVVLEDGTGIYEAEAIDNYASKDELVEAKTKDRDTWSHWDELPASVIATYYSALCFVNAKGMRFLLPAYMVFCLQNYDKSESASVDSVIYALDRGKEAFEGDDSILSQRQKAVISEFLKYMVVEAGDEWVDADAASRAYENHWVRYENKA